MLVDGAEESGGVLAAAGLARGVDVHGGAGLFATHDMPGGFALAVPQGFVLDAAVRPLHR